jgi:hypothetical protein
MRLILTICTVLLLQSLSAQSTDYDQRLLARYSAENIMTLQQEHPAIIDYWTYYLDHRVTINELPAEKLDTQLGTIEVDLNEFNILDLDISAYEENGGTLRIKGTNKVMQISSQKHFLKAYNAFKISTK